MGIYDPEKNNLDLDMWLRSDGDQLKSIMRKIESLNLSEDALNILEIALLTNSYSPKNKITYNEFIEFKINFLTKKSDFSLIKNFLKKKFWCPLQN